MEMNCKGGGAIHTFLIDEEDYDNVKNYTWHIHHGYVVHTISRKINKKQGQIPIHRLVMGNPQGYEVDHINGNKLDNRKCNLRVCTGKQNKKNRGRNSNNSSGFSGVFRGKNGKFIAYITSERERIHLGTFDDFESAKRAYMIRSVQLFGEFSRHYNEVYGYA